MSDATPYTEEELAERRSRKPGEWPGDRSAHRWLATIYDERARHDRVNHELRVRLTADVERLMVAIDDARQRLGADRLNLTSVDGSEGWKVDEIRSMLRDALRSPVAQPAHMLACSRCGERVTRSYEPGRCYSEQCEPAAMDEHDEAEPWEVVHGNAAPQPSADEAHRRRLEAKRRAAMVCQPEPQPAPDIRTCQCGEVEGNCKHAVDRVSKPVDYAASDRHPRLRVVEAREQEDAAMMAAGLVPRWRVGRNVLRNIYKDDEPIAMLATEDLAAELVAELNLVDMPPGVRATLEAIVEDDRIPKNDATDRVRTWLRAWLYPWRPRQPVDALARLRAAMTREDLWCEVADWVQAKFPKGDIVAYEIRNRAREFSKP